MINNRQNGRRRGRGGGGGGGQRQGGNPGRPDMGNRIDNRARGNANQLHEKYKNLAADAQRQGDRVNTEYYLQFADHYFRVLSEQRGRFEEQNQRRQSADPYDDFDRDGDDYGDEGEPIRADEQNRGREPRRDDTRRDEPRRDEPRGDWQRNRDEQGRDEQGRDEQPRNERRRDRDDQPRRERAPVAARMNGDGRDEREGDDARQAAPVAAQDEGGEAAEPRRRGRPRKVRAEADTAEAPAAFDADRLPPALGATTRENAGDEPGEERPRRRRRAPAAEAQLG